MTNYVKILAGLYLAAIIWSVRSPLLLDNWLLEMIPVFTGLPAIIYFGWRFKLSNLSFTLMFIYMMMLVIQAHYGVGYVPIGLKLAPFFETTRNVFDRITHFLSGLLWFYPLFQMTMQSIGGRNFLNYMIPAAVILALGAVYEVGEWLTYVFASARLSYLFIGAQDDFYDTPKDIAMSVLGVIAAAFIVFISRKVYDKKSNVSS